MKKGFTFFYLLFALPCWVQLMATTPVDLTTEVPSAAAFLSEIPSTILNDTLVDVPDTVYVQISDCASQGRVCVDIPPSEIGNFQITNNGGPYTGGLLACDIDTVFNYVFLNLPPGPYVLQSWFVNGNFFTGDFLSIGQIVDSMNVWDPVGNWALDNVNQRIIGGSTSNSYGTMVILEVPTGTSQLLQVNIEQEINGALLSFSPGINEVKITEFATGCVDSFRVQVTCIQPETIPIDTLFPGEIDTFCLNFFELPGVIDPVNGVQNICPANGNAAFNFVNGLACVEITAVNPGIDSACIVACDQFGFCDTTYLVVDVQDPSMRRIREYSEVVFEGEMGTTCLDTTQLGGPVDTIYSLCNPSETYASFSLDTSDLCLTYTGLQRGGVDTFCLVVCDATPLCDTNFVYVRVKRNGPAFSTSTLYLNQEDTFCDFDLSNLEGSLVSIQNGCAGNSGTFVDFTVDNATNCVDFVGVDIGQDTACIYLTDDQGIIDTTFLIVNVLAPTVFDRIDTIRPGNTVTYCLDTLQLGPNVLDTVFLCEEFTGTAVNIDINNVSLCIDVEAVTPGNTDTICLYVCDELQSCDTTNLIVTVREEVSNNPPIAHPDSISTPLNTSSSIDVCVNDSLFGATLTSFFVLPLDNDGVGPQRGIAFGNAECSITYIPEQDSCGVDSFSYVIRTEMGWDTTTVHVVVECPPGELNIYNAFSPNGDAVNPFFRIDGIENYPSHELYVYNRWGNLVLETTNYQNNWDGTWEGLDLPDGTYYYVFDTGVGEVLSGYVYISR